MVDRDFEQRMEKRKVLMQLIHEGIERVKEVLVEERIKDYLGKPTQ